MRYDHTLTFVGFCAPEMSTKFLDFAAAMDFGAQ